MVNRIATYTNYATLNRNTQRLQVAYNQFNTQSSSGLISETYGGLASKTQLLLTLEADMARKKSYAADLTTVSTRLEVAYDALNDITDTISAALSDLSAAVSGNQLSATEVQQSAQNAYGSIIASLNSQVAGRYLFGGSQTASPPVDVSDPAYPAFLPPSAPDSSYYQGNADMQRVHADTGFNIDYGITADASGFEKTLRALNLVINSPSDPNALNEAMELLQQGNDEIGTMAHQLSLNASMVEDRIASHTAAQTHLENTIAEIKEVDIATATVRAKQAETQLQATYSLTSSLLSLNILDYLR